MNGGVHARVGERARVERAASRVQIEGRETTHGHRRSGRVGRQAMVRLRHIVVHVEHLEHVVHLLHVGRVVMRVKAGRAIVREHLIHEHHELLEAVCGWLMMQVSSILGREVLAPQIVLRSRCLLATGLTASRVWKDGSGYNLLLTAGARMGLLRHCHRGRRRLLRHLPWLLMRLTTLLNIHLPLLLRY